MTDFYFVINYLAGHPGNFVAVKYPLRYSQPKLSGIYSAPMSAILRAIDSRSGDCGNDGVLLCEQLSSLSSWKFRCDGITTLIRPAEIIRDLQRIQMLAISRAADSRLKDCGNDEVFILLSTI
jgi:hypothetical protein